MESKFSLPHLQVPSTCPCPEPDQSGPSFPSHFLTTHLHIILPSTSGSSKWSLCFNLPHQDPVHTFPRTHLCYMTRPLHFSVFDHPNNIGWGVQITKFLTVYFSPLPCYFDPLRPKYFPQHTIFKHPQPTFPPQYKR